MKQEEFYNDFKKLCDYYSSNIYKDQEKTGLYYYKVKNMTINQFKDKCRKFMLNSKFMPRIAEFGDSIENAKIRNEDMSNWSAEDWEKFYC